ncbi:hypothetical protein D3C71_1760050 [compost metagenome]
MEAERPSTVLLSPRAEASAPTAVAPVAEATAAVPSALLRLPLAAAAEPAASASLPLALATPLPLAWKCLPTASAVAATLSSCALLTASLAFTAAPTLVMRRVAGPVVPLPPPTETTLASLVRAPAPRATLPAPLAEELLPTAVALMPL